ncbi:MAG TPA: DUF302 domain-containing protein [Chroococcales cyanobacterium]|jgi:uncharacterized protein (DUF302 family)
MKYSQATYWIGGKTSLGFSEALERTKEALKGEGFGVLCEADVQGTLKQKLGIERSPYQILGACNPQFAHQALEFEDDLGLLLPCNVIVYEKNGVVWIKAIDPGKMLSVVENPALDLIAVQVKEKIVKMFEQIPD